jgi:hypothetical protein
MEVIEVSRKIEKAIATLGKLSEELPAIAQKMADNQAAYDKALGLTLAKFRLGTELVYEGLNISAPPVTIMKDIAKAMCSAELQAKELALASYKAQLNRLENGRTCVSALQSIFRYLTHLAENK